MPLKYSDDKGYHYEARLAVDARVFISVTCPDNHSTDCAMDGLRPNKDKSSGAKKLQITWFCAPCNEAYITFLD